MSLLAPLTIRINDGVTDRHITAYVTGLKYSKTAPGGFDRVSMTVHLPRSAFPDLGGADKIYVYGPTGKTLWEGFADNPGSADGDTGETFELSGLGTKILASDESRPLMYRDKQLDSWAEERNNSTLASATADVSSNPAAPGGTATQGLLCKFDPGAPVGANKSAQMTYGAARAAGLAIAAVQARTISGIDDFDYVAQLGRGGGAFTIRAASTTDIGTQGFFAGDHFPVGTNAVYFRQLRTGGATNVTNDNTWTFFDDVAVVAQRVDIFGFPRTITDVSAVFAHEVVADLVGRLLRSAAAVGMQLDGGTYPIDQLAFYDGATAAEVLTELERYEPDLLWEFGASSPAGYAFSYRRWLTEARYEISTSDGYDAPGADVDLCNRVAVYWTDATGVQQTTIVQTLASQFPSLKPLEDENRIKDADAITLPEGVGSLANAQRAGEQLLKDKADPPKSARAVLARRVLDLFTGRWVEPWEIEPGYTVRVRETGDLLRLTETEFSDDDGHVELQLGTPMLTEDQRLAELKLAVRKVA